MPRARHGARRSSPAHGKTDDLTPIEGWAPLASFVVEFQGCQATRDLRTVVHHVEGDESQSWAGIETERVSHWMLERGPKAVEKPAEAPPPSSEPRSAPLSIGPMRLLSHSQAASRSETLTEGSLARWRAGSEPFALEVPLELESGSRLRGDHRVRLYADNLETSDRTHLRDASVASSGRRCTAIVDGCQLPEGVYRLSVLVSEGDRLAPTTLVAPLLRIG